jgi:hypothetical protein
MKTLKNFFYSIFSILSGLLIAQGWANAAAGDVTLSPTVTFRGDQAREGILFEAFNKPIITRFHTPVSGINAKKQVAFLDRFKKVTLADTGCGTGQSEKAIPLYEKFWEPNLAKVWLTPCWYNFISSFYVWGMKNGIDRADLSNTDLADYLMEVLTDAVYEDILRMVWFSETAIDDYASGGTLLAAADIPYYSQDDGFFKQIKTGVAIGAGTYGHIPNHTIDQNALATFALQMQLAPGQSLEIFKALLTNADRRLLQHPERLIVCTQSIFDNWAEYKESKVLESSFKNEDTQMIEGIFRSTPIIPFPLWDQYIQADFNNTVKYDKPHRAVLTVKDNLQIGFDAEGELQNFDAFLDKTTEKYHIKGGYKFDTMLMMGYLTSVAGF